MDDPLILEANHPPVAKLDHPAELNARLGDRVQLSARGSSDPDGDSLSYQWFHYPEAGTFTTSVATSGMPLAIDSSDHAEASFIVPRKKVLRNGSMHIILAMTDRGSPPLTRYARVIVNVPWGVRVLVQGSIRSLVHP